MYYAWMVDPAIYTEGAYPNDLASGYQQDYINMVSNAYLVDRQVENAQKRLQSLYRQISINAIGKWIEPPATPDKILKALGKC